MGVLVILSGGIDSTAVLAQVLQETKDVETLTFYYGSKHNSQENAAASAVAAYYNVPNVLIELPFIEKYFKSNLLKSGGEIPDGHYEDKSMKKTVVPFRNGIMLSIAAGYAESIKANCIALGNHFGDNAIYPDCRAEFSANMSRAIKLGTWSGIEVLTPFVHALKTAVVRRGIALGAPFHLTYSCYKGEPAHCGKCGTCVERLEAFGANGIKDPAIYQ